MDFINLPVEIIQIIAVKQGVRKKLNQVCKKLNVICSDRYVLTQCLKPTLENTCYLGDINLVFWALERGANDWNLGLWGACRGGHKEIIKIICTTLYSPIHEVDITYITYIF